MLTLYGKKTCFYKSILHGAQRSRQKYLTHSQPLVHTHMHTQPHTHTHTHPLEKILHPYNFLRLYSIIAATAAKSLQSRRTLCDLRWQPNRLHCPWDSPGKNTGVACHFLLQCIKVKSESEVAQSCPTLSDPMDYSLPGSSIHGIFQVRVLEWGAIAFSVSGFILG